MLNRGKATPPCWVCIPAALYDYTTYYTTVRLYDLLLYDCTTVRPYDLLAVNAVAFACHDMGCRYFAQKDLCYYSASCIVRCKIHVSLRIPVIDNDHVLHAQPHHGVHSFQLIIAQNLGQFYSCRQARSHADAQHSLKPLKSLHHICIRSLVNTFQCIQCLKYLVRI